MHVSVPQVHFNPMKVKVHAQDVLRGKLYVNFNELILFFIKEF